jgi:hypothetical protein
MTKSPITKTDSQRIQRSGTDQGFKSRTQSAADKK